jgi:hypothetical protein
MWVIVEVFLIIWMFKARPQKKITDKYPKKVVSLSQKPFGSKWIEEMSEEDIDVFRRYQYRIRVWFLSVTIPFCLIFLYLFLTL